MERRTGWAKEIIVHLTDKDDTVGVSFVGNPSSKEVFTHFVSATVDGECDSSLQAACSLAGNFEEATGIRWRLHDESKGLFIEGIDYAEG